MQIASYLSVLFAVLAGLSSLPAQASDQSSDTLCDRRVVVNDVVKLTVDGKTSEVKQLRINPEGRGLVEPIHLHEALVATCVLLEKEGGTCCYTPTPDELSYLSMAYSALNGDRGWSGTEQSEALAFFNNEERRIVLEHYGVKDPLKAMADLRKRYIDRYQGKELIVERTDTNRFLKILGGGKEKLHVEAIHEGH